MIGLDTKMLVRYLNQDGPRQARAANDLVERADCQGESLFINSIVLCGLVWVPNSCYSLSMAQIVDVLEKVLRTHQFEVESKDTVWLALDEYRESRSDFADSFTGRMNVSRGCSTAYTLDRAAAKLHGCPLLT